MIDVPNRSNLLLQIFLWTNLHISVFFALSNAFNILYYISAYLNLKGLLFVVTFLGALVVEALRLYYGYSGNLKEKLSHLSVFLIISPLIQLPMLMLLVFLNNSKNSFLFVLTNCSLYCILVCMCLEFFTAIYTFHKLCQTQSHLHKIKLDVNMQRELKKQSTRLEDT